MLLGIRRDGMGIGLGIRIGMGINLEITGNTIGDGNYLLEVEGNGSTDYIHACL